LGGMLQAIERGWVQGEIQNAAYSYQRRVETGEAVVVGVNKFTRDNEPGVPTQRHDPDLEQRQVERLQALRAKRSQQRWQQGIDAVKERAKGGDNLMPAILEAVESNCTVGEIAGALRSVFGEYRESVVI
jgi:methylmalonyl-CoA mutase, N-terminal domain